MYTRATVLQRDLHTKWNDAHVNRERSSMTRDIRRKLVIYTSHLLSSRVPLVVSHKYHCPVFSRYFKVCLLIIIHLYTNKINMQICT